MPPKVKISRDDIVSAGLELVRAGGADRLNARSIAKALGCSTQPVFSNFATMDELKGAVIEAAERRFDEYSKDYIARSPYPPYKAGGMAYISFAREESELFKLLYMRARDKSEVESANASFVEVSRVAANSASLPPESGELFHLEMWAYVHGIAVMTATGFLNLDDELISRTLTDVFNGLKYSFSEK